jgi:hypothetical protein
MKTSQNGFALLTILLIAAGVLVAGGAGYWWYQSQNQAHELIGGQTDEHGCLGPAGYSWCEAKQKCLRVWEEKCETMSTTTKTTSTGTKTTTTIPTSFPSKWIDIVTSSPATEICEKIGHYSLGRIPSGWKGMMLGGTAISCIRPTTILLMISSPDYAQESDNPGGMYGNLVLVNGARFEISADSEYPYEGCSAPSASPILNKPITEKDPINIDGYEGTLAHVQEPTNPPSPAIDYYYARIPISGSPCQMIDFVSVVSTTTDNRVEFQEFLNNLKFVPNSVVTPPTPQNSLN